MAVTDNFNRANGGLGANWTTDSAFSSLSIVSNTCKGSTGSAHNVAAYTAGGIVSADQYAQIKVAATGGGATGPVLRSNGAGTFYICFYPACTIYKVIAGSFTQIADSGASATPTINDVIYFDAVGNVLTMKLNGVVKVTVSDSSITGTGYPGIDIFDTGYAVDDFEATSSATAVNVSLVGVAADPQFGTGTVTIGSVVVTPPGEGWNFVAPWDWWPKEALVYLEGVAASPRIGSGTVRVTRGHVEIPKQFEFPRPQPEPIDSSNLVGDLAKLKILAKRKPPTIAVELIQPPPAVIKKPTVFVHLNGVEVTRVEKIKIIERFDEELIGLLDAL